MELEERFTAAVADSKTLKERPGNDLLLQLYALYKQATEGDAGTTAPGMFDFVARAKYEAWLSLAGKTKAEARQGYIELVEKLKSHA